MKPALPILIVIALSSSLAGCDGGAHARPAVTDETGRYPQDITPPPGTKYPCALTALPKGLPGIPEEERAYINRTYARILRATQTKLVLLKAMQERAKIADAHRDYGAATDKLLSALRGDVPPRGLEGFHADVIGAVELQRRFFAKGTKMRESGSSMRDVFAVSEGREASSRLIAAWNAMQSRYGEWPAQTKDSIYHHLCALDLF